VADAPIPWVDAVSPCTWAAVAIDWDTPAVANSISAGAQGGYTSSGVITGIGFSVTFGADVGYTESNTLSTFGTGTMGADAGFDHAHNATFLESVTAAADGGMTLSDVYTGKPSITLGTDLTYVNNIMYPESISVGATGEVAVTSVFLWNDVSDESTTWTDVEYPN
jgi:hypothetical protein